MEFLKDLHFFRKVPRDLTEATLAGGGLSLISTFVMAYLFISNIVQYLSTTHGTSIVLDRSVEKKLQINFNVTLPHLPCRFASVDVSDVMGTQLLNVSRAVQKHRIDTRGRFIAAAEDRPRELVYAEPKSAERGAAASVAVQSDEEFSQVVKDAELVLVNFYAPWCPWSQRLAPVWEETATHVASKHARGVVSIAKVDCTSASMHELCQRQHVHAFPTIRIYRSHHAHSLENYVSDRTHEALEAFVEKNLPQHASPTGAKPVPFWEQDEIELHAKGGDGCIVHGALLVNRVPGNFHITAHSTSHTLHMPALNVSHAVGHLSFGKPLSLAQFGALPPEVGAAWNPLHGTWFSAKLQNTTIEHYLKVVHTSFERTPEPSTHISTYQYTVNSHSYEDHDAYPALVFSYDLSPIEVIVKRERESLAAFLTQVCAIIGGVFTVTGLLDSIVYHGDRIVRKKMEIGKAI